MIKVISFDLDGTLVKRTFADLVWLEGLPRIYATEKGIPIIKATEYLKQEYDRITDTRIEWYDIAYWFTRFNLKQNWKSLLDRYRYAVQLFPEVSAVVKRLHKKYELIVTSNAKKEFIDTQLEETGLKPYFTQVFSSTSDFHMVKKTPAFYAMICDTLHITPREIVHVGDHEEFDYRVPQTTGILSFYLDREKTHKGQFIIVDLHEFEKQLMTI